MSSANDHLPPPPKPRMSPLDFRNTDLVSRLLAATPPYLYNMSLLPNTYFFSEMLRSFVQAKNDQSRQLQTGNVSTRRPRKRPWSDTRRNDSFQKFDTSPKSSDTKSDSPLELTTDKPSLPLPPPPPPPPPPITITESENTNKQPDKKHELSLHDQMNPLFSNHNQESTSNLILPPHHPPPPPPPIWYPPIYPTPPYGIDPLHFFIDLRVSGHIYDRKNQKDTTDDANKQIKDNYTQSTLTKDSFKQSRHTSAFTVPIQRNRNVAMNLSNSDENVQEMKNSLKFDVKSMGFEKDYNKTGTSYIMNNINNIYKNIVVHRQESVKSEETTSTDDNNEDDEQKKKRVKDLRALIGLELVVDYMNHSKPTNSKSVDDNSSSTDIESVDSPAVEVVALPDNET